nr:hypothetical protein 52 [Burkholderiaceae bacterium]
MKLITVFCSHNEANSFYQEHHRTHGPITNFLLLSFKAITLRANGDKDVLGYCTFARPAAPFSRKYKDTSISIVDLARICFAKGWTPQNNAEKKYFSKFIRQACFLFAWQYRGVKIITTYLHLEQSGKYLQYAGFVCDRIKPRSKNCKGWQSRPNRKCSDTTTKKRFILPMWQPYIPWLSYMDLHWNYVTPYFQGRGKLTKQVLDLQDDERDIQWSLERRADYSKRWCSQY